MIATINNFLDTLFNSHEIILFNDTLTLFKIDVGQAITYILLSIMLIWISFLGFKIIRWLINYVG